MGKKSVNPINNKVAELMKLKGITQEAVAQAIDRSQSAVNERLSSDKPFPLDQLRKIAELFGESLEELVRIKNETPFATGKGGLHNVVSELRSIERNRDTEIPQEALSNHDLLLILNQRFASLERSLQEIKAILEKLVNNR